MFSTNDRDTFNRDDFNEPIQYINDFLNSNPMPFTTGVYNQEPISYIHPYTLYLPPITPQYTSSRYAIENIVYFT